MAPGIGIGIGVGRFRGGGLYGPEMNTTAGADSDPNGNEADATTDWVELNLNGTGANVFESQGVVVNVGSFAIHAESNDTPTDGALCYKPFVTEIGESYKVTFDARHVGVGSDWIIQINATTVISLDSSMTTFASYEYNFVADATEEIILFRENSGVSSGGIYADNISWKKVL